MVRFPVQVRAGGRGGGWVAGPGAGQLCAKSHPFKIVCHKR